MGLDVMIGKITVSDNGDKYVNFCYPSNTHDRFKYDTVFIDGRYDYVKIANPEYIPNVCFRYDLTMYEFFTRLQGVHGYLADHNKFTVAEVKDFFIAEGPHIFEHDEYENFKNFISKAESANADVIYIA